MRSGIQDAISARNNAIYQLDLAKSFDVLGGKQLTKPFPLRFEDAFRGRIQRAIRVNVGIVSREQQGPVGIRCSQLSGRNVTS
jgi:hypothetical protein